MPSAHAILWFLGAFVGMWALSLLARGIAGDGSRGRRRCPSCFAGIAGAGRSCSACGYEARSERALHAPKRNWRMIAAGAALLPVGAVVCYLGAVVWAWSHLSHDVSFVLTMWDSSAVALAGFGLGVIAWAIRGERSRGRRRCPSCWYDMTGSGLRCPECGHEARHASRLYGARRRWRTALLGSLMLLVACVLPGVPRVQRGGWRAAFPSTVLIAGLPWLPDDLAFEPDAGAEENWTLLARWEADRLWGWQKRWLERRARGQLAGARTAGQVRRSLQFGMREPRRDEMRRALALCLGALSSGSQAERDAAVECLAAFEALWTRPDQRLAPSVRPLLPRLMSIINDDQQPAPVVWAAVWGISLTGPAAAPAVPRVLQIAAGSGRLRALITTHSLRRLAVEVPEIKARIVAALDDPDPGVAMVACAALSHWYLCDDGTAGRLLGVLRDGDDARAAAAADTLCRAMWRPGVAIPAILDELGSARTARARLAEPLWNYEDALLAHLPRLAGFLEDPDPLVRVAMIGTVSACERGGTFHIRNSALFPIIAAMQDDPDPNVSRAARTLIEDSANSP